MHGVVWAMSRTSFRNIVLAADVQNLANFEAVLRDMKCFQPASNRLPIAKCHT